jgi:hypothetical protein
MKFLKWFKRVEKKHNKQHKEEMDFLKKLEKKVRRLENRVSKKKK